MSETPLKRQPSRRSKRTRSTAGGDDQSDAQNEFEADIAAAATPAPATAAAATSSSVATAEEKKRSIQIQSQVAALLNDLEPATPAKASATRPNLVTPQRSSSRAGAAAAAVEVPATPTRATREEEQKQLRELNKRLEIYILRQREKDAQHGSTPRELELYKDKKESELNNLRKLFEDQLATVRADRDRISNELAQSNGEKAMRENLFAQQLGELNALKKYKRELEEQNKRMNGEYQKATTALFSLEDQSKRAALELESTKTKSTSADKDAVKNRERADAAAAQLAAAVAKARALQEDLDLERKRSSDEVKRYEATIIDLTRKTDRSERDIRTEFHKQMAEALAARQQIYEDEKSDGLQQLKFVYDEKMVAFREELEKVGHELELEKNVSKSHHNEISRLTTLSTELMAIRDSLANRIAELEDLLKAERLKPNKLVAEKNDIIRRIKAAFKRKDAEFDELMDVKIALAMEIKAYRAMLESEEDRIGIKSPLKKRKRNPERDAGFGTPAATATATATSAVAASPAPAPTPVATATRSSSSTASAAKSKSTSVAVASAAAPVASKPAATAEPAPEKVDNTSSLLISGADLEGHYITIRNGSTEIVPLVGWSLRSKQKSKEFKFPDIRLLPGQSFVVRTLENQKDSKSAAATPVRHNSAGASAWCSADVWDRSGDEALLTDPEGEVIARVEIIPMNLPAANGTPIKSAATASPAPAAAAAASSSSSAAAAAAVAAPTSAAAAPSALSTSITSTLTSAELKRAESKAKAIAAASHAAALAAAAKSKPAAVPTLIPTKSTTTTTVTTTTAVTVSKPPAAASGDVVMSPAKSGAAGSTTPSKAAAKGAAAPQQQCLVQ